MSSNQLNELGIVRYWRMYQRDMQIGGGLSFAIHPKQWAPAIHLQFSDRLAKGEGDLWQKYSMCPIIISAKTVQELKIGMRNSDKTIKLNSTYGQGEKWAKREDFDLRIGIGSTSLGKVSVKIVDPLADVFKNVALSAGAAPMAALSSMNGVASVGSQLKDLGEAMLKWSDKLGVSDKLKSALKMDSREKQVYLIVNPFPIVEGTVSTGEQEMKVSEIASLMWP